ncbi:unnamed protein product, partial [Mesorhabditis spiculigera]
MMTSRVERADPAAHSRILAAAAARPAASKDKDMISAFPIPLAFIGAKYDEFQNFESEDRRQIVKVLRFLAHYYCADLLEIGPPPQLKNALANLRTSNLLSMWRDAFDEIYKQKELNLEQEADNSSDALFAEKAIDKYIEQKNRDLELYIRQRRERKNQREALWQCPSRAAPRSLTAKDKLPGAFQTIGLDPHKSEGHDVLLVRHAESIAEVFPDWVRRTKIDERFYRLTDLYRLKGRLRKVPSDL